MMSLLDFRETTEDSESGYPLYKRPNNNRTIQKRGVFYDNRHVVPYNPYLTLTYNAHINVEICSSVRSVKYIYKYVYKGPDRALFQVRGQNGTVVYDEITQFIDAR